MKLFVPFILISSLLFKKLSCQFIQCETITLEKGEAFFTKKSNPLICEADDDDSNKLNFSEYSIIKQQARVENFQVKQIISNLILPPFIIDQIFENLYCHLRKSEYYFISCIKESNLKNNTRQNIQDLSTIFLKLNIQESNICQEFFFNENQEFDIFCIQGFDLNLYRINFQSQTILNQKFNIEQFENEGCKRQYLKLKDSLFLIVFYQCSNWGIFTYTNNTINLILNEEIAQRKYFHKIQYLENVQLCQLNFYLIVETGYYQFGFNNQNKLSFYMQNSNLSNLKQLVISQNCNLVYYIQYSAQDNKTIIYNSRHSYQVDDISLFAVHLFQNILFIQFTNQLQVIFSKLFQQVIIIDSSKIYINSQFNTLYQLDLISDEIIFYVLCYPRNFIRPTKTYVHLIYGQSSLFEFNNRCYKINYNSEQSILSNTTLEFDDICQNRSIVHYSKQGLSLMNQYQIQWSNISDFNISIFDNKRLNQICSIEKQVYIKNYTLIQYNKQYKFLLFKTDNYIYKYNCDGQLQLVINIKQSKVYQYQNSILIWDQQRILRLFKVHNNEAQIIKFKFESEIIDIIQCENIIIVFAKDQSEGKLINFDTQEVTITNQQPLTLLYKIFNAYQQNNQAIKPFYYAKFPQQFIQFLDYLIIFSDKQAYTFRIEQTQIVMFKVMVYEIQYLLGVHLINNQIIEYKLNLEQLSILNVVDLNENEIIRPITYQINQDYFSIAVRHDMKTFIILFSIQKTSLKLINTIQIGRDSFFFHEQYLIYYDKEDILIMFNMANFEIQIENVHLFKSHKQSFNFNIVPINSNESSISLQFTLRHYNKCYQLQKKTNNASLYYSFHNKTKIYPTNYFYGPIDTLKLLENDKFQIEGPLVVSKVSLDAEEGKIYTMNLNTIFQAINFRILYLVFQNNTFLLFNKLNKYNLYIQEHILLDIILINPQSTFMIFRKNETEIFRGVTYCIDEITHQLQKEPLFEVKFDLNDREKGFQSIKTGNLIVFKGLPILLIYQIVELNLKLIPNQFNIIEIIKIKGDNQLYVSLSLEMNDILLFQILIVNEIQFESKGSAILKFENIRVELFNHFRNYQLISFDKFRMLEFLECLIEDGQVKIIGLLMIEETQVISEIIIQMVSFRISYNLIKITRINLKSDDEVQLVYYCQNILILRLSSSAITYFYDLTGNQVITDYIGRQTGLYHSYHILNTTHLVVYSNLEDIIFFAEVGYEIHFNEVYQGNNTFTLVAQNMLSSIQLNVTMIDINHGQIQDQNYIIIYLSIFILTLVVYFLIRRRKIKYQLLNNQKFDGIDLNNQQQND